MQVQAPMRTPEDARCSARRTRITYGTGVTDATLADLLTRSGMCPVCGQAKPIAQRWCGDCTDLALSEVALPETVVSPW